jgi:transcriptional regulator with XRE-family HTH domain
MNETQKTFGELLREARSQQKKMLKEVGDYVGKSVTYMSDLEHGRKGAPDLATVARIEQFLLVTDGRLAKAASTERWSLPKSIIRKTQRRQVMAEVLLRANEMTDEQIRRKWLNIGEGDEKDA